MQADDPQRVAAVRSSGLLLGRSDATFDRAARTAARCTGAPVALVTIVGGARQHFVGAFGLTGDLAERRSSPLATSRCRIVVAADEPVVAGDAATHAALGDLAPIDGLPVGAYLGVPLRDADGVTLGAVCVVAPTPRTWEDADVTALQDIAGFLQAHLTLRATTQELRGRATTPVVRTRRRRGGSCSSLPLPPRRR